MSIASRTTSIIGHIKDDYNALERLGADLTNVDNNIENIASVVDNIYDKLPKVTGTGSDLSLTPTLKGGMNIVPLGNAEQNSYNGKNLLNASAESYTLPASTTNYQTIANIDLVANTKYYISYNIDNTSSSNTRSTPRLYYQQQYIESGSTNYNLTTGRKVWEFTPSASGTYQFQYWLQNSNVAVTVSKFMISTSSDTTYEKYVGGIPSPNPSYPQDVKVVTGDNQVVVCNKNLFNAGELTSLTQAGITFTPIYDNGLLQYININGIATANVFYQLNKITLPSGNYIINGCTGGDINTYSLAINFGSGRISQVSTELSFTLSEEKTMTESFIRIGNGTTLENVKIYPMIRYSNIEDNSYVPHQEQSTTLHLGSLELCKIGDYQDVITGTKDNWKVVRQVGKVVYTGASDENWIYEQNNNGFLILNTLTNLKDLTNYDATKIPDFICNQYIPVSYNSYIAGTIGISERYFNNTDFLRCKSSLTNANAFKTYLSTNNLIVYYPIATPTETPVTDTTLINELNGLQELLSYDGTTNITITSDSNNAQMLVQVSALKGE